MTLFVLFPRINNPAPHSGAPQGQMVLAVSHLVSFLWGTEEQEAGQIPQSLNLSAPHRELLKRGVHSYLLPGQEALQRGDTSALPSAAPAFEKHVSSEILKVCSVPPSAFDALKVSHWLIMFYFVFSPGLQREACISRGFHGLRCRV